MTRFLLILLLGAVACGDDDETSPDASGPDATADATLDATPDATPDADPPDATPDADANVPDGDADLPMRAEVRLVHASPGAPEVDLAVVGGDVLVDALAYGSASAYAMVDPGDVMVELRLDADDSVVLTETLTVAAGGTYTVVAAGLAGGVADDELRLLSLEEGFAAPGATEAIIRVVHAGADAPAVDIDLGLDGVDVPNLMRFAATPEAGVPLDITAPTRLEVAAAGGAGISTFTVDGLAAGAEVFVIATGLAAELPRRDEGFSLLAVLPSDGTSSPTAWVRQDPRVYALHLALDVNNVDVFAGPTELVDDLAFAGFAGPVQVSPAAGVTLDVFPTSAGSMRPAGMPAASDMVGDLEAGERYLFVATGILGDATDPFQIVAARERMEPDPAAIDRPRVVAIHAAPDANMNVQTMRTGVPPGAFTVVSALTPIVYAMPTAEEGITLDETGMVIFGVSDPGEAAPDVAFDPFDFTGGFARYFLTAGGAVQPTTPPMTPRPLVRLVVVRATDDHAWTATVLNVPGT
ncbi:MAG: DUF4397 domain-containing protein [Myxococcota bacterium]